MFNKVLGSDLEYLYFTADRSGHEGLKNSGVLDRLQGRGIETLLADYYDTVSWIERYEESLNERLQQLALEFNLVVPADAENFNIFYNPSALSPERFAELQPVYDRVINGRLTRIIFNLQLGNFALLQHYDRLIALGDELVRLVDAGSMDLDAAALRAVAGRDFAVGDPQIVAAGLPRMRDYWFGVDSSAGAAPFALDSVRHDGDVLHFSFDGDADWASFYFGLYAIAEGRPSKDFSQFDKLVLELRGDAGGETVTVALKDRDDPDDEPPPSVTLTLSDSWEIYEIELASFPPVDLDKLHIPLAFVLERENGPVGFSVRSARYVALR